MAFQNLLIPIVTAFNAVGIKAARGALGNLTKDFGGFAKEAGKAAAAFGAAQAIMGGTEFIKGAVNVTQQYERNMLALQQVFEKATPEMTKFTVEAASMGISQAESAKASVFLGSVLKQYGMNVESAGSETRKLVGLSQDLATTYGYDLQEALLAMTALFRGEYDPIEKFGVAMKQNEINSLLAARGQDKLTGAALAQATVATRLELLYQRAGDSLGAFDRANGTLYASQQKLNAAWQNTQLLVGEALQEPLANLIDSMAEIATKYGPEFTAIGESMARAIEELAPHIIATVDGMAKFLGLLPSFIDAGTQATKAFSDMNEQVLFTAGVSLPINKEIDILIGRILYLQTVVNSTYLSTPGQQEKLERLKEQLHNLRGEVTQNAVETRRFIELYEKVLDGPDVIGAARNWSYFEQVLTQAGIASRSVEGALVGVGSVLGSLGEEIAKSEAGAELDRMGFSAAQIEFALTQPNWQQIFGQISRLAQIASMDIYSIGTSAAYGAAVAQGAAQATLNELRANMAKTWQDFSAGWYKAGNVASKAVAQIADPLEDLRKKVASSISGIADSIVGAFQIGDIDPSKGYLAGAKKMLARLRAFATELKKLSSQGLHPALLQQVMSLGATDGLQVARDLGKNEGGLIGGLNEVFGDVQALGMSTAGSITSGQSNYYITVNGGVGDKKTIGTAIVDAIKSYERSNGIGWRA